jgi:hypothetical protein
MKFDNALLMEDIEHGSVYQLDSAILILKNSAQCCFTSFHFPAEQRLN